MFSLAKELKKSLELAGKNWNRFEKDLRKFSGKRKFARIRFRTYLTRQAGWEKSGRSKKHPNVNAPYRMYDYPNRKSKKMLLGRISRINQKMPHLLISLHMTWAGKGHPGGMAAVLSPGYKTFNLFRSVSLGRKSVSSLSRNPWYLHWLVTEGYSRLDSCFADTWVYFHGYRTKKGRKKGLQVDRNYNRGIRQNLITWKYADPNWVKKARKNFPSYTTNHRLFQPKGIFWDRERSIAESWRREKGYKGFGGDNYYAADELLRFTQFGLRILKPTKKKQQIPGPLRPPFVSSYSLPIYVNSITAYLEIGFINRKRDVQMITQERKNLARSLAVGVYSLFAGMNLKSGYPHIRPPSKTGHRKQ